MRVFIFLIALSVFTIAQAATYELPDPDVQVNLNAVDKTVVSIAGVTYIGPSKFVYVSECVKPDVPYKYLCDIKSEKDVTLTEPTGGKKILVSITYQAARTLIRSGINYWRPSNVLLNGTVATL